MDIIVGTAGHIDHGKTALVKALTGIDADRLPEEKRRGITIDLGFAELDLGDVRIGFVDVPGHEKFVKNMLAGAGGIDLVLMIIAADEGVMPQTREHFEICRLLETKKGIIVLTKTDLVDEELLELVKLDVQELVENSFLENAPMLEVSAKTGAGIENLKQVLLESIRLIPARTDEFIARLPIDRSFTIKGFGAVITGTLISGEINEGGEMELLPVGRKVRIRGLQTHGKQTKNVHAGQRTAVNLGGIEQSEIERGMVLCEKDILRPTQIFDAEIEVLKNAKKTLKSRARVRVHIGTIEALARIQVLNEANEIAQGAKDLVQLRLEIPVVTIPGERFILRSYSPQITIAGGQVLDNLPNKHRRKDIEDIRKYLQKIVLAKSAQADEKRSKSNQLKLNTLQNNQAKQLKLYLETANEHGLTFGDLQARTGWRSEILRKAITENIERSSIIKAENFYVTRTAFDDLKVKTLTEIENFHRKEPLARGIMRETLREKLFSRLSTEIFKTTLSNLEIERKIITEKDLVRAASHNTELTAEEKVLRERFEKIYRAAKLEVPKLEDALSEAAQGTKLNREAARKVFQLLINSGEVIKITDDFYFTKENIENLTEELKEFASKSQDRLIDVPTFKDIAKISRKYAIPLLEYFDRQRITRRAGDKRLIL